MSHIKYKKYIYYTINYKKGYVRTCVTFAKCHVDQIGCQKIRQNKRSLVHVKTNSLKLNLKFRVNINNFKK